jgi:hypothetical protein
VIPNSYKQHIQDRIENNDGHVTFDNFLKEWGLVNFSLTTTLRWMHLDHLEPRCLRWVQIQVDGLDPRYELEKGHIYDNNGTRMVEFHEDYLWKL